MSNTKRSSSVRFSAVLCSGSHQTHPSDNIMEPNANDNAAIARVQSESGPGVVARLMGLDSLPEKNWVSKGETLGQVTQSRSVNFMYYMLEFDLTAADHRRVKTSTSFCEVLPQGPPLLQQHNQNHEFLVVYMDEKKEIRFEPRELKSQKLGCKDHQEKNKKISKLENKPMRVSAKKSLKSSRCIGETKNVQINRQANSRAKSPLNEVFVEKKKKKKKQCEVKKVEYSENSSEEDSKSLEVELEKNFKSTDGGENVFCLELVGRPPKLTDEDIKFSN
ncbi:hypothetical protein V6N13_005885 [Hibiscus sabdariffa]